MVDKNQNENASNCLIRQVLCYVNHQDMSTVPGDIPNKVEGLLNCIDL